MIVALIIVAPFLITLIWRAVRVAERRHKLALREWHERQQRRNPWDY